MVVRRETLGLLILAALGLAVLLSARPRRVDVIIDPGHGGRDPGAIRDGVHEATLTLEIARRVETAIRAEVGLSTRLTHTGQGASLADRVVASASADLFISIHLNATPDVICTARGAEAYVTESAVPFAGHLEAAWRARQGLPPWRFTRVNNEFFVLRNTRARRAVLLECGFLCNPADLAILRTPAWQDAIAAAIAFAVRQELGATV